MAFHEVQFPTHISYGSRGGPGFRTSIIEADSGATTRVARWANARRQYDARYGVGEDITLFDQVFEFYLARGGCANGFRWKDWFDFTSASDHRSAPAALDQYLGTGDGSNKVFQLQKTYSSGAQDVVRTIQKPVASTTLIQVNGTPTVAFAVDTTSGQVTMDVAPPDTHDVYGGWEHDVPVQFGAEIDEGLLARYASYESVEIDSIPIIEMVGDVVTPERFWYGGGRACQLTGDTYLEWTDGRMVCLDPNGANRTVYMPETTYLDPGGPYHIIENPNATYTLTFKTYDGATTLWTLGVESSVMTFVYLSGSVKYWGGMQ